VDLLKRWLDLSEQETALKREVKDQDASLDELAYTMYQKISETDIKCLVVDDKWMARINAEIMIELERVSQSLTSRIRELSERYNATLSKLADEMETRSARVDKHLKNMGMSLR
jgi:type I restriction enzyme M protein